MSNVKFALLSREVYMEPDSVPIELPDLGTKGAFFVGEFCNFDQTPTKKWANRYRVIRVNKEVEDMGCYYSFLQDMSTPIPENTVDSDYTVTYIPRGILYTDAAFASGSILKMIN